MCDQVTMGTRQPNFKSILANTVGLPQIAEHYGISRRDVYRHLVQLGWLTKGKSVYFVKDEKMLKYRVVKSARGSISTRYYLTEEGQKEYKKLMVFLDLYPKEV